MTAISDARQNHSSWLGKQCLLSSSPQKEIIHSLWMVMVSWLKKSVPLESFSLSHSYLFLSLSTSSAFISPCDGVPMLGHAAGAWLLLTHESGLGTWCPDSASSTSVLIISLHFLGAPLPPLPLLATFLPECLFDLGPDNLTTWPLLTIKHFGVKRTHQLVPRSLSWPHVLIRMVS